ncbi:hypothetical protein V5O48_011464 [Marasmius crinis-equi]|uniref:NACHT domain-containing protein n=1 Tax=Marasmius crinis-equi TaxID=585013 RepID=A0ABR3F5I4_9AGAR
MTKAPVANGIAIQPSTNGNKDDLDDDDAVSISFYETGHEVFVGTGGDGDGDSSGRETERENQPLPPPPPPPPPTKIDGNGNGIRRKSDRVSLKPQFLPTPPAIEDDPEGVLWAVTESPTSIETPRQRQNSQKGRIYREERDRWDDPEEEEDDNEYASARRLLKRLGRKEKEKGGSGEDGCRVRSQDVADICRQRAARRDDGNDQTTTAISTTFLSMKLHAHGRSVMATFHDVDKTCPSYHSSSTFAAAVIDSIPLSSPWKLPPVHAYSLDPDKSSQPSPSFSEANKMQEGPSQYSNTGSGIWQHNNTGSGQNINYGGDQNINQRFGAEIDSRVVLWDAIKHVGFSHKAEQQFLRGECLEGTREEVLQTIHGWRIPDGWELPICWLSGAAGVGKTSIAMTVAKSCEEDGLLMSFFFFRSDPDRNNPSALILAIAYGLAAAHSLVREEIDNVITTDRAILGARLEEQFQKLILLPIAKSCARAADDTFAFKGPTLVIIDGLDECGDEEIQSRILSAISSAYHQYPHFPLQFLICSRPEAWIREAFKSQRLLDATKDIVLDDTFDPTRDIKRYYIHEFRDIRRSAKYRDVSFPDPWPSERDFKRLLRTSDGQFAHASTAVRFVRHPYSNPMNQLHLILNDDSDCRPSNSPFHTLDSLYHTVLRANPSLDKILPILAAIVIIPRQVYVEPSPAFIELLLELSPGDVSLTLRALHSVLDIRGRSDGISVFHTSFTDYLFDHARSGDFFIDKVIQREFLAQQWLHALSSSRIRNYK